MLGLVKTALLKPYTFIVLAIVICIIGPLAALRTPTDVFPDIGIPVVAVVWQYTGLSPDAMAGRVIYTYERSLSTTVNDIEHIESQSLPGMGIVKIFFQPGWISAPPTPRSRRCRKPCSSRCRRASPRR